MKTVLLFRVLFLFVLLTDPSLATANIFETDPTGWPHIDQLILEQKYNAACDSIRVILDRSMANGHEDDWTNALVKLSMLQIRQLRSTPETAVRLMQNTPWPTGSKQQAPLQLYYGLSLQSYCRFYGSEIRSRENNLSQEKIDLKQWSMDRLNTEINHSFAQAWADTALSHLDSWLVPGNYPERLRGTTQDAVVHLWVDYLKNKSLWSVKHTFEAMELDPMDLIRLEAATVDFSFLDSPGGHPLLRIAVLMRHLQWNHLQAGRPEAALEAELRLMTILHKCLDSDTHRLAIRKNLEERLSEFDDGLAWWSVGQYQLGEMYKEEWGPENLIRAHEAYLQGARSHPESIGGQWCQDAINEMESASFNLKSMSQDSPGKRSILIMHKNMQKVYFRAWRYDLAARVENEGPRNPFPDRAECESWVQSVPSDLTWTQKVADPGDFHIHHSYTSLPPCEKGAYLVGASLSPDFKLEDNRISTVVIINSDLVVLGQVRENGLDLEVCSGETGEAQSGVPLKTFLLAERGKKPSVRILKTNDRGEAFLPLDKKEAYFILAQRGEEVSLTKRGNFNPTPDTTGDVRSFVYTDRPVYRPGQPVMWKIVVYQTVESYKRYEILAKENVTVLFSDANRRIVGEVEVTTNEFGSASGIFDIPEGALLGRWSLSTSHSGKQSLSVEEYKRPTYEIFLDDPPEGMRLGEQEQLTGRVAYKFGQPMTSGQVKWKIERNVRFPDQWVGSRPRVRKALFGTGETELLKDGTFTIDFLPIGVDDLDQRGDVVYDFQLNLEILNDGGESLKKSRHYIVGKSSIKGYITAENPFVPLGRDAHFSIRRTDLNSVNRPGQGIYTISRLAVPEQCILPADIPLNSSNGPDSEYMTQGDNLRPRWISFPYPTEKDLKKWPRESLVKNGGVLHDEDGLANVTVTDLSAGVYRLMYTTEDGAGIPHSVSLEFIVADKENNEIPLCLTLLAEEETVQVGDEARFFVHSDLQDQPMRLYVYNNKNLVEKRVLKAGHREEIITIPITTKMRGRLDLILETVSDFQVMRRHAGVNIPWDNQELTVEVDSGDIQLKCGTTENIKVKIFGTDGKPVDSENTELLAFMYDASLDFMGRQFKLNPSHLFSGRFGTGNHFHSLGYNFPNWNGGDGSYQSLNLNSLHPDRLILTPRNIRNRGGERYVRGGRSGEVANSFDLSSEIMSPSPNKSIASAIPAGSVPGGGSAVRDNFAETGFFLPHLNVDEKGEANIEFQVPDSVTQWRLEFHALTNDLQWGIVKQTVRSSKDLLVRPYLTRFLREGDLAQVKVILNNSTNGELNCLVDLEILDQETGIDISHSFGLKANQNQQVPVVVPAQGEAALTFQLKVPNGVGVPNLRVVGRAGDLVDGELRPIPVLPSRVHLQQSRFVALDGATTRVMNFDKMNHEDPTLKNENLVITVDAQLFQSVLNALPYLVSNPYKSTEQTLNSFLSSSILSNLFHRHPETQALAKAMAKRETETPAWGHDDPNQRLLLEESPWLIASSGQGVDSASLINILDPETVEKQRDLALGQLEQVQGKNGGFSWMPGGAPSPYMTLYVLQGIARDHEFGGETPENIQKRAWAWMSDYYFKNLQNPKSDFKPFAPFLVYVMSSYPEKVWAASGLNAGDRDDLLNFSFQHWGEYSPLLKGYLSLALARNNRLDDARLVFDSVLDSANEDPDLGVSWTPEDRSWLWTHDTIEGHASALRVMTELYPDDGRANGLAHWLLLNRHLNHWKSTRATAEAIYALVLHMEKTGTLISEQAVTVKMCEQERRFEFSTKEFTGQDNQWIQPGAEISPEKCRSVTVISEKPGLAFASATWMFSTEQMPDTAEGNLLQVTRDFYRRVHDGTQMQLEPLRAETVLKAGDEVEVHLSVRSLFPAEYVHLRDPRPAGFEPLEFRSGNRWQMGLRYYEEVRDNGMNYFFEKIPDGEFVLKHRMRANVAGQFLVGPATLQSMYAPEFTAYSSGAKVGVSE